MSFVHVCVRASDRCKTHVHARYADDGSGRLDLRTNQPSSSSRLDGAGSGAAELSVVGRRTYPLSPNGFQDCNEDKRLCRWDVLTGTSVSR